ncbi:helix-turn-helix domain-containing protein [Brevibacillus porteri]|uniref:helix-turn-helix domain-containing protein n=1 Tax=Brevibacillus porteri TaxID=2126350 RepID=UPI003D1CCF66
MFENKEKLTKYVVDNVMTSGEVLDYLGIERQTLHSLVKRGKLVPLKKAKETSLFLRQDIEDRKTSAEELKEKFRPYE